MYNWYDFFHGYSSKNDYVENPPRFAKKEKEKVNQQKALIELNVSFL